VPAGSENNYNANVSANPLVDDWLRVHRELMEKEAAFTAFAMRAAAGEVTLEKLDQERQKLMALRARCTAVYEKAFPKRSGGAG
jgi:hypothetical protein